MHVSGRPEPRTASDNNTTLSGDPVLTKNIMTLDEDWKGASPGSGADATNWSAKWTGNLKAPVTGVYTFAAGSDDGSRVLVDGKKIVDHWGDQQPTTASASVKLTAGQSVTSLRCGRAAAAGAGRGAQPNDPYTDDNDHPTRLEEH